MTTNEWTKEELDFVKRNRYEMSYGQMGEKIGRTRVAVMVKLKRMGLTLPEKFSFNRDFFETIDSEEKSYWLGFLYADGYVSRQHELAVQLKAEDGNHLKKLNKALGGNIPIKFFVKHLSATNKDYKMCSLRIYSKKIVQDVGRHGLVPRKSTIIEFPALRRDLTSHFIRGFFDGDGCIRLDKSNNQLRCDFTCASLEFMKRLSKTLGDNGIYTSISDRRCDNKSYRIYITGKENNKNFLKYIYSNATTYLDRKYKTYCKNKDFLEYLYEGWKKKQTPQ